MAKPIRPTPMMPMRSFAVCAIGVPPRHCACCQCSPDGCERERDVQCTGACGKCAAGPDLILSRAKPAAPPKNAAGRVRAGWVSVLSRTASINARVSMYNANALKIDIFGANCSSSRTATRLPERWSASWRDCLELAQLADAAGIDFMLPIGRWKGYGGETDFHGATLETVTWAAGLLASTERITVFGTVHAPLFNPIIAAKMFVTADQIGE